MRVTQKLIKDQVKRIEGYLGLPVDLEIYNTPTVYKVYINKLSLDITNGFNSGRETHDQLKSFLNGLHIQSQLKELKIKLSDMEQGEATKSQLDQLFRDRFNCPEHAQHFRSGTDNQIEINPHNSFVNGFYKLTVSPREQGVYKIWVYKNNRENVTAQHFYHTVYTPELIETMINNIFHFINEVTK